MADAQLTIDASSVKVQYDESEPDPPLVDVERGIRFNGAKDSHEQFILSKSLQTSDSCKTARKPYDVVVTTIVLRASVLAKDGIDVRYALPCKVSPTTRCLSFRAQVVDFNYLPTFLNYGSSVQMFLSFWLTSVICNSSDGDWDEWMKARRLYERIWPEDEPIECPWVSDESDEEETEEARKDAKEETYGKE